MEEAGRMYTCIECGKPVKSLYREYSKDNIRLTRCIYCHSVADKYIEYEMVLLVLDLALQKLQAYRHILFNRRPYCDFTISSLQLWKSALFLLALDAHLRYVFQSTENELQHISIYDGFDEYQVDLILKTSAISCLEDILYTTVILVSIYFFFNDEVISISNNNTGKNRSPRHQKDLHFDSSINNMGMDLGPPQLKRSESSNYSIKDQIIIEPILKEWKQIIPKILMALLFPNYGKLFIALVMTWEKQMVVPNVATVLIYSCQVVGIYAVILHLTNTHRRNESIYSDDINSGKITDEEDLEDPHLQNLRTVIGIIFVGFFFRLTFRFLIYLLFDSSSICLFLF